MELHWTTLPGGEDLVDFLSQPLDPQLICSVLNQESISSYFDERLNHISISLHPREKGLEMVLEDRRPGGRDHSVYRFEERHMLMLATGFTEVRRGREVQTGEFECQNCLQILPGHSTSCSSCGSTELSLATIPSFITYTRFESDLDRSNEEFMTSLWKMLLRLSH